MRGPFQYFRSRIYCKDRYNRIPQLIIEQYIVPKFVLVNEFTKGETERGQKVFGSSGGF